MRATTGTESAAPLRIFPPDYLHPLRMADWFPREVPLEVDVGCGSGSFLTAMAARHPERNFLGIERLFGRVQTTCGRGHRLGLTNLRVLRLESRYAVQHLLSRESVSVCHVLFPDPWPKRRHHRRRLLQADFLDSVHAALVPGGELRIKTDDAGYFAAVAAVAAAHERFKTVDWVEEDGCPKTDFEMAFLRRGLPIYRLRIKKL